MLATPRLFGCRQFRPTTRRCALVVLLVGVLVAAATGGLLPGSPPAPQAGWTVPAEFLAASDGGGTDSGGTVCEGGGGNPGSSGPSTTIGAAAAPGTAQISSSTGTAGASADARSGGAALSRVAAGLVDVDTVTNNAQLLGTGMIIRSDGLVLTNHHVIDHATQVRVRDLGDNRVYRATIAAVNTTHDLALLRLQGAANLTVVPFGDSRTVKVGDLVTALGNAGGGNSNPIAAPGAVTALNQAVDAQGDDGTTEHLTGMIQANASAAPGDSGGPTLNAAGAIIGVTTAGADTSAGDRRPGGASARAAATPPAVVDATPINVASAWIKQVTAPTAAGTAAQSSDR